MILAALTLAVVIFAVAAWGVRVPAPGSALVLTGRRRRVVTDRRVYAAPGLVCVRRVSLGVGEAADEVDGWTAEGLPVVVGVHVTWRVGDTAAEIIATASLFPRRPEADAARAKQVRLAVAGRLRDRLAATPIGELIAARESLADTCVTMVGADLAAFGLRVEALRLTGITDPTGALADLYRPHRATIAAAARVGEAHAAQWASRAEQVTLAAISAARRDAEVARAGHDADVDRAGATARMAGPLEAARLRSAQPDGPPEAARLRLGQAADGPPAT